MSGQSPSRRPQWATHPRSGTWRWWSGHHWTQYGTAPGADRPRLPPVLSVPVVIFGVLFLLSGELLRGDVVLLLAAATMPSLLVLAFLLFLDRVEPEPAEGRWHALLWGALVAGLLAGIINSEVEYAFGESASLFIAAPVGEELLKVAGILWAVRRKEIDDALDGAIYAGWVAVGFTISEDLVYYMFAADGGYLLDEFIGRGLTSFAHPLFTVWVGIAVGRAVERRTDLRVATLRGLAVAIPLHAVWNMLIGYLVTTLAFLALLAFTIVYLRRHEREFRHDVNGAARLIADAAATSPLSPTTLRSLDQVTDPDGVRELRSAAGRRTRRAIDAERTAIVRIMLRARRAGMVQPAEILELSDHLDEIERLAGSGPSRPPASVERVADEDE
jgi:RsiW-degrading membrane proteinase PrsW (M82 family)